MAYSLGGYYAPRIAAFERRYAACVVFGSCAWDIQAMQIKRKRLLDTDPKRTSQSSFQFPWVLGVDNMEQVIEAVKPYSLAKCAGQISCPFLVTHGVNDRLASPEDARLLYEAVGSKSKSIKIFTPEDGGSEHCHVDNRSVGVDYVADWLTDVLVKDGKS